MGWRVAVAEVLSGFSWCGGSLGSRGCPDNEAVWWFPAMVYFLRYCDWNRVSVPSLEPFGKPVPNFLSKNLKILFLTVVQKWSKLIENNLMCNFFLWALSYVTHEKSVCSCLGNLRNSLRYPALCLMVLRSKIHFFPLKLTCYRSTSIIGASYLLSRCCRC